MCHEVRLGEKMAFALLDSERQENNVDGKKRIKQFGISCQSEVDKKEGFQKAFGNKNVKLQEILKRFTLVDVLLDKLSTNPLL
jgi:hypothetical protein